MRTLIKDTPALVGQEVTIRGWVNTVRAHGQLNFIDIRDRSGIVQVVGGGELKQLKGEYVIEVVGLVKDRDPAYFNSKLTTGKIELQVKDVKIISRSQELPFDIHQPDLNLSLPVLLDYRAASLRHHKISDVFRLQAAITQAFREYMVAQDFTEFHAPSIVATATEGGSEVFPVDYFGYKAYLAQSPQLYKQIMVSIFERVFTVAHAYRAEPSVTTRHLTEYVSLDAEMGFIDSWLDVVHAADDTMKYIFKFLEDHHGPILDHYQLTVPKTIPNTPIIKLKEALNIIYERTGRDVRQELDMDPEGEREICRWAEEKFGSEMVFITHFYTKKRAWYSFPDPENPEETLSFDLIGRGVEWISGSQRIHNYEQLIEKINAKGFNPANFESYLQAFRFGMPPEGGFAIGLERVTQNIFGFENIRQATLYPRDMERVDVRLSQIGQKYATSAKVDLHQKLLSFLDEKSIKYQHLQHAEVTTSQEAASVRGTKLEQGAKALIMFADNQPILVVLSAAQKLDNTKFKQAFGIKDLRLATPPEVTDLSSVPIGAVPPFGNLFNLVTYVDQNLLKNPQIAFNAGSRSHSVIMNPNDLVNAINPKMGSFAQN